MVHLLEMLVQALQLLSAALGDQNHLLDTRPSADHGFGEERVCKNQSHFEMTPPPLGGGRHPKAMWYIGMAVPDIVSQGSRQPLNDTDRRYAERTLMGKD